MQWIKNYQLFLFDFDGLLVNTEQLHFAAYKRMCSKRGLSLNWDWRTYCLAAHYNATGIKEKMYADFPKLQESEPNWEVLYAEKKKAYLELLQEGKVQLMPGVAELLQALEKSNIKRCVVTHSPEEQISVIRKQIPLLNTIANWITREYYNTPKPHPECYQKAISLLSKEGDKIIGFEDTSRGLNALLGTQADAILISNALNPSDLSEIRKSATRNFDHYLSFSAI